MKMDSNIIRSPATIAGHRRSTKVPLLVCVPIIELVKKHAICLTGQYLGIEWKSHGPPRLVIFVQLEQLDALVTGVATDDICHHPTIVRSLQLSHRDLCVSPIFRTLESTLPWSMEPFA